MLKEVIVYLTFCDCSLISRPSPHLVSLAVQQNVEHCGGEPEQVGYYGYMHMNRLNFTLK